MTEKQQQLTFEKGITNVPSDALCPDNTLEECVGMFYDNGEHRVVQKPVSFMTDAPTVLYVHRYNDNTRYITKDGNKIKWGTNNNGEYDPAKVKVKDQNSDSYHYSDDDVVLITASGEVRVSSIGKTLIISDNNGLHYFIWKGDEYNPISYPFPDIALEAKLVDEGYEVQVEVEVDGQVETVTETCYGRFVSNNASSEGIIKVTPTTIAPTLYTVSIFGDKHNDYNNLVVGLYSKNLKEVAQSKCFSKPFLVRAALELYDGTYTNITNPILLFPSITESTKFYLYHGEEAEDFVICTTQMLELFIRQSQDFSDYSDVIKDVVIFASRGIDIYSTGQDQPIYKDVDDVVGHNISSLFYEGYLTPSIHRIDTFEHPEFDGWNYAAPIRGLKNREAKAINNEIEATSVFYKLASIGLKDIKSYVNIATKTTAEVIENLEVQETLGNDDYYSHSSLVPKYLYSYNSRLNIANVSRSFYKGSDFFLPFDREDGSLYDYVFDVTIKKDDGVEVIVRHIETFSQKKQGIYFYYPDSRATHVQIYKSGGGTIRKILDVDLKEHPFLNGAYYFSGMSPETDEPTGEVVSEIPTVINPSPETLPNYIIQSEVNNPFLFKAAGYFKVGTGKILGMSTITQALSEGQFGQYPLLVFSEVGVWSLSVASTGYYGSLHPMSREVALVDNPCITQTDGAVFFASSKGLMVIVGNQVKCASEQLSGKSGVPFKDYMKNAFIAYDYRDSLLWIFDGSQNGSQYCYLYSIKTGTFSRYDFGQSSIVTSIVNNYPDFLLQSGAKLYSLLNRPNINSEEEQGNSYSGQMITRPMKLENALALKSIMQIKHIKDMDGALTINIFASNNLKDWCELSSLRGTPWKYYKFQYNFSNMKATDRFAGSVLITQERRTDKLR